MWEQAAHQWSRPAEGRWEESVQSAVELCGNKRRRGNVGPLSEVNSEEPQCCFCSCETAPRRQRRWCNFQLLLHFVFPLMSPFPSTGSALTISWDYTVSALPQSRSLRQWSGNTDFTPVGMSWHFQPAGDSHISDVRASVNAQIISSGLQLLFLWNWKLECRKCTSKSCIFSICCLECTLEKAASYTFFFSEELSWFDSVWLSTSNQHSRDFISSMRCVFY